MGHARIVLGEKADKHNPSLRHPKAEEALWAPFAEDDTQSDDWVRLFAMSS
jgi:hypothetical protein